MTQNDRNNLFPLFLKLENMKLLIVGGGNVGLEKLQSVLANSPATRIHLVATQVSEEVRTLALIHENIRIDERIFLPVDLEDAQIVIVAIDDYEESRQISLLAKEKGLLVNVADKPELCDFYLSSVVRKKNLKIAISTNGKSPTIAKRLREVFDELLPDELEAVLDNLQEIRNKLKGDFASKVSRLNELTKELSNDNKRLH
jgi:siroheme synthase-like protein